MNQTSGAAVPIMEATSDRILNPDICVPKMDPMQGAVKCGIRIPTFDSKLNLTDEGKVFDS
jgi:hypothetical protein